MSHIVNPVHPAVLAAYNYMLADLDPITDADQIAGMQPVYDRLLPFLEALPRENIPSYTLVFGEDGVWDIIEPLIVKGELLHQSEDPTGLDLVVYAATISGRVGVYFETNDGYMGAFPSIIFSAAEHVPTDLTDLFTD